ncbi:hypothetical protein AAH979_42850 [Plantactinospora sp. ZYX-F-223]|uniref:hypothetical protein n=1 Tax=Plantactinospora sp. ZYX-F-223 TaxID=3144103 RepID=UPI0031FDEDC4
MPDDKVRRGAHVTEITGLLTLADGWQDDLRVLARTEPLHPRHRKQASEAEKHCEQRFQAIATDLPGHPYPKLDAFHRNHAGIEPVIKDGKDLLIWSGRAARLATVGLSWRPWRSRPG